MYHMMTPQERNTYVKKQITNTLLKLLETRSLNSISVSMLVEEAGVARVSFYRNYNSLTDVIAQYDMALIKKWGESFEASPDASPLTLFSSLFRHYKSNEKFYMMLYRNNLTELIGDTIVRVAGPKPEMNDDESYRQAFLAYGIYGWVREWMRRGMKDIPEDITKIFPNGLSI